MSEREMIIQLLRSKPVAYLPDLAKATGSVKAGLLLSQLLWWSQYSEDGWVFRTQQEIYEETGLSRTEQENARRYLKKLGILVEEKRGMPARNYYRVETERLLEVLREYYQSLENQRPHQIAENLQTSLQETDKQDCRKPANKIAPNVQTGEPSNACGSMLSETHNMRNNYENKNNNYLRKSLSNESDLKERELSLKEENTGSKACLTTSHKNGSTAADGSATAVSSKSKTSTNSTENGEGKVRSKSRPSTNEDPQVKELAKKLSALFYRALKEEGVPYTDYGKLMRIAKKFASYGKHLIEKEDWNEEKVLFFGAMCIAYYLSRNNPRPEAIYGMPAENLAILRRLKNEKPSYFERLRERANQILDGGEQS